MDLRLCRCGTPLATIAPRECSPTSDGGAMSSRGLEILTHDECVDMLRTNSLGRIAVRIGEAPAILPVSYGLLDDDIVFRTDPGSKLSAALMRVMVAFEVDDLDAASRTGSSVVVTGYV